MPEARPRVLVSDTVGFIDKLPHGLVASFKSTLDEALEAGLLAQVVDASAPTFERQLAVTTEVLADIGAGDVPRLLVFNKIDACGDAEARGAHDRSALLARWPERGGDVGPPPRRRRRACANAWSRSSTATSSRGRSASPTIASSCAARSSPPARCWTSATTKAA